MHFLMATICVIEMHHASAARRTRTRLIFRFALIVWSRLKSGSQRAWVFQNQREARLFFRAPRSAVPQSNLKVTPRVVPQERLQEVHADLGRRLLQQRFDPCCHILLHALLRRGASSTRA